MLKVIWEINPAPDHGDAQQVATNIHTRARQMHPAVRPDHIRIIRSAFGDRVARYLREKGMPVVLVKR